MLQNICNVLIFKLVTKNQNLPRLLIDNLGFYGHWCPFIYIVILDYIYIVIQDLRLYCNTRYTQFKIWKKKSVDRF